MQLLIALVAGLLFGLGLILSGMTDPSKITGFLDLAGQWNPSLMFVMGGAVMIGLVAFLIAERSPKTLLGDVMRLPETRRIDRRLVLGGLTFGVGWGLAGYCPGPALTSLASGGYKPALFVLAMLAGMAIFEILDRMAGSPSKQKA